MTDHRTTPTAASDVLERLSAARPVSDSEVDALLAQHGDSALARALATDPHHGPQRHHAPRRQRSAPRPRSRRRVLTTRIALAATLVAAASAGVVIAPSLVGTTPAFAGWTASPNELTPVQARDAAQDCRSEQANGAGDSQSDRAQLESALSAVAERRGQWTTVYLVGDGGFSALCVTWGHQGFLGSGMIGSVGTSSYPLPGPRQVSATDLGTTTITGPGQLSLAAGLAGSDIAAMTYRSPSHGEVTATVNDGGFAFWLPGDDLENASSAGADVQVTYRDGTTGTATLSFPS